jgi:hypothetical protein
LTEDQEQEIYEYFDPIYMLWISKKHLFNIDRSNFMYNALVLQVCRVYNHLYYEIIFMILKYPPCVIRIFNMIKGESNLKVILLQLLQQKVLRQYHQGHLQRVGRETIHYGRHRNHEVW